MNWYYVYISDFSIGDMLEYSFHVEAHHCMEALSICVGWAKSVAEEEMEVTGIELEILTDYYVSIFEETNTEGEKSKINYCPLTVIISAKDSHILVTNKEDVQLLSYIVEDEGVIEIGYWQ